MKIKTIPIFITTISSMFFTSCNNSTSVDQTTKDSTAMSTNIGNGDSANASMILDKKNFESTIDAKQTDLYLLKNHNGMQAAITNYGGRLVSLMVPDKNGKMTDVVVGFKSVDDYVNSTEPYFGATIGRYGNRIARGKFSLDGKQYTLLGIST